MPMIDQQGPKLRSRSDPAKTCANLHGFAIRTGTRTAQFPGSLVYDFHRDQIGWVAVVLRRPAMQGLLRAEHQRLPGRQCQRQMRF